MKNIKIRTKMIILALVAIAALAGVAGNSITSLNKTAQLGGNMFNDNVEPLIYLTNILANGTTIEIQAASITDAIVRKDAGAIQSSAEIIQNSAQGLQSEVEKYIDFTKLGHSGKDEVALISAINNDLGAVGACVEKMMGKAASMDVDGYRAILQDEFMEVTTDTKTKINELVNLNFEEAKAGDEEIESLSASSLMVTIIISVIAMVVLAAFSLYIIRNITKPINRLIEQANAVAIGDVEVRFDKPTKDEIGVLTQAFISMVESINQQAEIVSKLAGKDFGVKIEARSEKDKLSISLNDMVQKLNEALTEAANASNDVASGSQQIAAASQSLAQGSTEQAAAVEEIASTVAGVNDHTQVNNETAKKAASLAKEILAKADEGSSKMENLIAAVMEINNANNDIIKVMKIIDDIAFQTNILALNAAVEAARAGSNGKGFAVVAEEVRRLAGKSAEAAKETGDMITLSIQKAEIGKELAVDTSAALNEIVKGIAESTEMVESIASASKEQAVALSQVNTGVNQISQVVSANTATSEECAASSEQLSESASSLNQIIAEFKLMDTNAKYKRRNVVGERANNLGENVFGKYDSSFGKY